MTEVVIIEEDNKYKNIRNDIVREKDVSEQYVIVAEYFLTTYRIKTNWFTKEIYIYNYPEEGIYNLNGEILLLQEIQRIIPQWKHSAKKEIIDKIMINTYFVDNIFNKQNIVVIQNGVIRLDFLTLEKEFFADFSSDYLATKKLPIKYDAQAVCPKIDQFFIDVANGNKEMPTYLLEILADVLNNHYKSQVGHIFIGDGENGKGTFLRLLIAFVGMDNKTSLGLEFIQEGSFQVYTLQNSMVNIIGDLNDKYVKDTGLVKKLLGEDFVSANIKNVKKPIEFINTSKMILAGQHIMRTEEDSWAWFRRFIITSWTYKVPLEAKVQDFETLLHGPRELSGLLNKVLVQYKILSNNKFKYQLQNELTEDQIRIHHLLQANPVKLFAETFIEFTTDDDSIPKRDLYKAYCDWQIKNNAKHKSENYFHKELRKVLPEVPIKQVKRVRHYMGIELNETLLIGENKVSDLFSTKISYTKKIVAIIENESDRLIENLRLFKLLKDDGYTDLEQIRITLDNLLQGGNLYEPKPGYFKAF